MNNKLKKLIKKGFGFFRESAEQVGETVGPGPLIEHALGQSRSRREQSKSEVTKYLQSIAPDISQEELEKRKRQLSEKEQEEVKKARKVIRSSMPAHMRLPQKERELRPYEKKLQEEEEKKAMADKMREKSKPFVMPSSPDKRPGAGRKGKKSPGMEQKDRKKVW